MTRVLGHPPQPPLRPSVLSVGPVAHVVLGVVGVTIGTLRVRTRRRAVAVCGPKRDRSTPANKCISMVMRWLRSDGPALDATVGVHRDLLPAQRPLPEIDALDSCAM